MAIMQSLTFGGINSLDYGVYITGEGVYDAPTRDVEMIAVPGRNGDIVIDHGRYENIQVKYTAGCFGDDQSEFASKMAEFRMALVSQIGYQRLEDTYHPGDYREGIFVDGFEVAPTNHSRAGEFELIFNCKPQRFVADGQTEVTIAAGGTVINNPTPFDAYPLLKVEGYGTINVGSQSITLSDRQLGFVQILPPKVLTGAQTGSYFASYLVNSGDDITVNNATCNAVFYSSKTLVNAEVINTIGNGVPDVNWTTNSGSLNLSVNDIHFTAGTTATEGNAVTIRFTADDDTTANVIFYFDIKYTYNAIPGGNQDLITAVVTSQTAQSFVSAAEPNDIYRTLSAVMASSTASALGHPTYIDCSIGEVYRYVTGVPISLNSVSDLGTDLPKLAPGNTTVSYSGNVTSLKAIPRWWKL